MSEFYLDADDVEVDEVDRGSMVDRPGKYLFEIVDCTAELDTEDDKGSPRSPCVLLHCLVLETAKGQSPVGSRYFHRIYFAGRGGEPISQGGMNMTVKACLRLGLLIEKEVNGHKRAMNPRTGKAGISPEELIEHLPGKRFTATVELKKGDPDKGYRDQYQIPYQEFVLVDADVPVASEEPTRTEAASIDDLLGDDL